MQGHKMYIKGVFDKSIFVEPTEVEGGGGGTKGSKLRPSDLRPWRLQKLE